MAAQQGRLHKADQDVRGNRNVTVRKRGDVDISLWRVDSVVGWRCRSGEGLVIIGLDGGGFCRCPPNAAARSSR